MRISTLFLTAFIGFAGVSSAFAETRQGGNVSGLGTLSFPVEQTRYVSLSGSDANCDGSSVNPCRTLDKMQSLITDAAITKKYLIVLGPGNYLEVNTFTWKEHVSYKGQGRVITQVGHLDNSVIEYTVPGGYTTTTNGVPNQTWQDMTILGGTRLARASSGITVNEQFFAGFYDMDFVGGSTIARAGTVAIGSFFITGLSSTSDLRDGMTVSGTGIPASNTTITVTGQPAGQVLMSAASTANNSTTKTFTVPAFSYNGAGIIQSATSTGPDQLDMRNCTVTGQTLIRGVSSSNTTRSKHFGSNLIGTTIFRDDGTVPTAFATVTASDSGLHTVTVAPGSNFYVGGDGAGLAHVFSYPTSIVRVGSGTSGGNTLTGLNSTLGFRDGMTVTGTGVPASTTITITGQPANTVLLSNTLTATTNSANFVFGMPLRIFSYDSYNPATGVFTNALGLFGLLLPSAGETITTYGGNFARMEMSQHGRVIIRSTASDYGASLNQVDFFGGSVAAGSSPFIFDGVNSASFSDIAGLSSNANPTFINSANAVNLTFRSRASLMNYVPTTIADWLVRPFTIGEGLDYLASTRFNKTGGTITGATTITGSADAIQLDVQGFSTQTSLVNRFRSFAGTVLESLSNAGDWFALGNATLGDGSASANAAFVSPPNLVITKNDDLDHQIAIRGNDVEGFCYLAGGSNDFFACGTATSSPFALQVANSKSPFWVLADGSAHIGYMPGSGADQHDGTATPLTIRGASTQSVDLLSIETSGPSQVVFVDSTGDVHLPLLTANRALALNSSKEIVASTTSDTELGYLTGAVAATQRNLAAVVLTNLTADDQVVSVATTSNIQLSSDSAVATDRTFVITQGASGQKITIQWVGTNAGEFADDGAMSGGGNVRLSAVWLPTQYDTLSLVCNGTDCLETGRSTN